MIFTFRPIDSWPGTLRTEGQRQHHRFDTSYQGTLGLLGRELERLDCVHPVIQLALKERDIRNDGLPRAQSKPEHPGVILAFGSRYGDLKYATDVFKNRYGTTHSGWQANLRAIALGLEALRKVDRYGISKSGEQYTGWKELGAGIPMIGEGAMTVDEAIEYLDELVPSTELDWDYDVKSDIQRVRKFAALKVHPDAGGSPEEWSKMEHAITVLLRNIA